MSIASLLPGPEQEENEISGLSQAKADSRYVEGQDNSIAFKHGRSRSEIVREAVFNVYTFDLLGVAAVFWLLEQPLSALFSIAIMVLIFGYNITLAFRAKDKLAALLESTRPEASVIRDSKLRAVDPNEIVRGDAVVVGPGDQFFADGRLLSDDPISVNESLVTGSAHARSLHEADTILAGSYCLAGHGIYQADAVGDDRRVTAILADSGSTEQPMTPLERIVRRVLGGLRVLVLILGAYIILHHYFLGNDPALRTSYENALSIILSLAPGGIYFMILMTYITGSSQLANAGALVQRAESVETLAQTDILCLGKAGTLTGALVDFTPFEEAGDKDVFSESHLKQILGDIARSTRSRSKLILSMKESFDGTKRMPLEDALYLSLAGWQGIVFDDDDLEGTFILGFEKELSAHLDWTGMEDAANQSDDSEATIISRASKLLFVFSPELKRLHYHNGRPLLPENLIPLGYLLYSEEIRPDAKQTTDAFTDAGIALKVLSSQKEAQVTDSAIAAGISNPDGSPPDHMSGPELADLPAAAYGPAVARVEIFSGLNPDQKGEIIHALKGEGALVTMVGDSVADLSGQKEANLSVTFRDSSQASLSMADMILLDDGLNALPAVLELGQGIFNRLLDVLKLTLTHATTAVLLTLVAIFAGVDYFPYLPAQNTAITIITITLPAIGLSFWLQPGQVRTNSLGRRLAFFILPAGISIAILVLIVHILIQHWTGSIDYGRVLVTHLLVGTGLLLVLFVQPPTEFWVGGDTLSGDRRPITLVVVLWFLFIFFTIVPLTKDQLDLQPLNPGEHYLLVFAVLAVWVLSLRALWRSSWFRDLTGYSQIDDVPPYGS